eukprot:NODE_183_length_15731_cov_0.226778.p8 type:complete len:136 gc:universal NODE_183_length_15731_cov_0.226778:8725-8318(-)
MLSNSNYLVIRNLLVRLSSVPMVNGLRVLPRTRLSGCGILLTAHYLKHWKAIHKELVTSIGIQTVPIYAVHLMIKLSAYMVFLNPLILNLCKPLKSSEVTRIMCFVLIMPHKVITLQAVALTKPLEFGTLKRVNV